MTFVAPPMRVEVPPEGDIDSLFVLIGEAPGRMEVSARPPRPFVGPSGALLDECLGYALIPRSTCRLTNVFKVEVQKKGDSLYIDNKLVFSPKSGFTEAGMPWVNRLHEELKESHPNAVIIPLGNAALWAVCGHAGIMKYRGSPMYSTWAPVKRKVIPTTHPAAALRQYLLRYFNIKDLTKARKYVENPALEYPPHPFLLADSVDLVLHELDVLSNEASVALDIETYNQEVNCLGLGTDKHAIVIPFMRKTQHFWSASDEAIVWRAVAKFLANDQQSIIGVNLMFDLWVLMWRNRLMIRGPIEDVMVLHHIIYPEFLKGLDTLTSIYTDYPYYKDDGKQWFKAPSSMEQLWKYNADDIISSYASFHDILTDTPGIEKWWPTYRRTMDLYPALLYMQTRGMLLKRKALEDTKAELLAEAAAKQLELDALVGHTLNVGSSQACQAYFYIEKGIRPYTNRKTGRPTTDNTAMKRLARGTTTRPPMPEARLVLDIRGINKLVGTYLDIEIDSDERLRCSINPAGTKNGRLSTSKTVFGTGTNMQNLPQQYKRFLVADPGCVLVEIDKSQAEWVVCAYYSGDGNMIDVCESGEDAHVHTAHLAFGVPKELIVKENKIVGNETDSRKIAKLRKESLPEILQYTLPSSMSCRQAGKKGNHGLNYGMGPNLFAATNELPNQEAKFIWNSYHKAYPGIHHMHAWIRTELGKSRTLTNLFDRPRRFYDRWGEDLFKDAYAFPAQSTVVDLVNIALTQTYDTQGDWWMRRVDLLMQVHDSILFQYYLGKVGTHPILTERPLKADPLMGLVRAVNTIQNYMNPTLTWQGRSFTIGTDFKIGLNWAGSHSVNNPQGMREMKFAAPAIMYARGVKVLEQLGGPSFDQA